MVNPMKNIYISDEERKIWNGLCDKLRDLDRLFSDTMLYCIQNNIPQCVIAPIDQAETILSGHAYMCTPQPEWQGEESWKCRQPHIMSRDLSSLLNDV